MKFAPLILVIGLAFASDVGIDVRREERYFPGLNYGHNRWTSIRLENRSSEFTRSVEVEAYREDGSPMIAARYGTVTLAPLEKLEFRLAGEDKGFRWCWAKVINLVPRGESAEAVSVTVTIEVLKGNQVEQFERMGVAPLSLGAHRWVNASRNAQGKQLYYLNTSTSATVLSFCQAGDPNANCDRVKPKLGVNAKGSVAVNLRRPGLPYSIAETPSGHAGGILLYLAYGSGNKKTFGADSSIVFGSEVK